MKQKQTKIIIIVVSCLLHLLALILLLVIYHSPTHSDQFSNMFTPTALDNNPETVFYDDPQSGPQPVTPDQPVDEEWGQLNPRASTFGSSMEMPTEPIGIEHEGAEGQDGQDSQSEQTDGDDPSGSDTNQTHTVSSSYDQPEPYPSADLRNEYAAFEPITKEASPQKKSVSAKKRAAQKAIAHITKGYLQQLTNEGNNLIKTLGGDPNKRPTAEQLKYERYLAKIQWCLQNAHNIRVEKCQNHKPVEATMKLYFTLDRNGKMDGLRIVQTSGDTFVDAYIVGLFEFASNSFPPLPSYIKENPYQLYYTVMVNWNLTSSSHMGFTRN